MSTISLTLPSDGQTIDAADVNTPFNTIATAINGNLDDTNIASGANINGTKLLANSIPPTAYDVNGRAGWNNGIITVMPTVTALGNRSYSLVHASTDLTGYLSPGMRLKLTRTVAAPTQCTSLNGTTQYWSKASPNKLTFTVTYTLSAWIKVTSYAQSVIVSRLTGTSGWALDLNTSGQLRIFGENTGNGKQALSYQSVPLNKWTHVAASMDMTSGGLLYMDGVLVPSLTSNLGAGAVALAQSGDLNVGAIGGAQFFPGKIAQVAIYDAVISAANILATVSQTLSGSETSLKSAYSFNAVVTDLNTATPNDLTANGSAVATSADSPFAQGATAGTLEYGIITAASFSTNTTLTVQVPEGSAIPTSGGVSALSYSTQKVPYGFPGQRSKWRLATLHRVNANVTSNATYGSYNSNGNQLIVPVGEWVIGHQYGILNNSSTTAVYYNISPTALTGLTNSTGYDASPFAFKTLSPSAAEVDTSANIFAPVSVTATQTWVLYTLGATTNAGPQGAQGRQEIYAEFDWV